MSKLRATGPKVGLTHVSPKSKSMFDDVHKTEKEGKIPVKRVPEKLKTSLAKKPSMESVTKKKLPTGSEQGGFDSEKIPNPSRRTASRNSESSINTIKFYQAFGKSIVNSEFNEIDSARNGIQYSEFEIVYDLFDFSNKKWAEILGIGERSIQAIIKEKKPLDLRKSEKLIAFISLVRYGIHVFGNLSHFKEWLFYKSPALEGLAPIHYLDTFQGIEMLKEQLFGIETGNLT